MILKHKKWHWELLVSALTCKELEVKTPILKARKKAEQTEDKLLFLDPSISGW